MQESRVLKVRSFHNRVDWTRFLAEAAENTFGHVDIVFGCAAGAVWSWFRLDTDGEGGAGCFTEFAGDAAFFTGGVAAECVFTSEHGGEGAFFPWVVEDVVGFAG